MIFSAKAKGIQKRLEIFDLIGIMASKATHNADITIRLFR